MAYFLAKILIALGLMGLAGIVLAILKSKKSVDNDSKKDGDDWDQF